MLEYNSNFYWKHKLIMLLKVLVLIGSMNWGTTAFGYNFVAILSDKLNSLLLTNYSFDKIIYIIVGLSAVFLLFKKNMWLPFLGHTVLPEQIVQLKKNNNFNIKINVIVNPNSKVIYWAALGTDTNQSVFNAYKDYTNSGVIMSNNDGIAELTIQEGQGYTLPSGATISRHIHYRVFGTNGLLGPVETIFY